MLAAEDVATEEIPVALHTVSESEEGTAAPAPELDVAAADYEDEAAAMTMRQPPSSAAARCANTFPVVTPSLGGSTIFVYHGPGVEQFRKLVLTPFFDALDNSVSRPPGLAPRSVFTAANFLTEVNSIGSTHLGTTLTVLAPANALNVFVASAQARY
jgi:hypothetical protein